MRQRGRWMLATAISLLVLAGCTAAPPPIESATGSGPQTLAEDLDAPWSVVPLLDGPGDPGALISQRDDGAVLELTPTGTLREVGIVPGVVSGGESGLHGLALWEGEDGIRWLYAYHGAAADNRVVRMPLTGEPGALSLDLEAREVVFSGIPRAGHHDGGRIGFGPDGMLYVATGDAGRPNVARDPDELGGKILRLTPEGEPAPENPFGTAVYSIGHRNVQGLAWDDDGTLWASEFGQNTWDELNRIEAGGDYGWPDYEGMADAEGVIDPVTVWRPGDASPSGIAALDGVVYVSGLRGERLWMVDPEDDPEGRAAFTGEFGRLRDVVAGPQGTLWILTNNTDGRGAPRDGDDRLVQLTLPED